MFKCPKFCSCHLITVQVQNRGYLPHFVQICHLFLNIVIASTRAIALDGYIFRVLVWLLIVLIAAAANLDVPSETTNVDH